MWDKIWIISCLGLHLGILLPDVAWSLDLDNCANALGMQTGEIPDYAITASSSYDPDSVGPTNARIRTDTNGGAWCPGRKISSEVYEYLEIDLQQLKVITLIETQGRFGQGQGQEFADQYMLEYQREDDGTWFRFRNRRGQDIIAGNTNQYASEFREIDPPIIAKRIRFIPYSERPRMVCMRVEMYGCEWPDGTISYTMMQGQRRGTEVDLLDFTYDGTLKKGHLVGGLGQLTDGEQGQSNFRLDPTGLRIKGYEWIGWRNESFPNKPVELIFKFDAVRNFTTVRLYSNNMYNKDVRVFRQAKIWFSIGGEYYLGEPVDFQYMRDELMEFARPVIVPLHHGVGQYVKLQLYFDAKWMMISEVQFESEYAVGNFTDEVPPFVTGSPDRDADLDDPEVDPIRVIKVVPGDQRPGQSNNRSRGGDSKPADRGGQGNQDDTAESLPTEAPSSDGNTTGWLDTRTQKNLDDQYIGIIIGALAALILLLFAIILFIFLRHRRNKYNNNHRTMKPIEPRNVTMDLSDIRLGASNGKVSNGNMYNFVATSDGESDREDTNRSGNYAVPGDLNLPGSGLVVKVPAVHPSDLGGTLLPATATLPFQHPPSVTAYHNTNPYRVHATAPPMVPSVISSPYASTEVATLPNIQGVSGNNVYAVPGNLDFLWAEDLSVMEFPRDKLKFQQKLGEGQFGEVHLCEATGLPDLIGDDLYGNRAEGRGFMVAVKMLRRTANEHARSDFQKEVKILSRLKDPNIVRVLGVCTRDEPLSVVVEYMKYGDLHQYLQKHVLEGTNTKRQKAMPQLSYGCLIYMASQVASGMKYLETLNMVHRDLATRNCLVGNAYTIKISDFGMSRSLYSSDYYRIEGKAVLPIRWMAWECVLLGKFSCKSDVWSFGVTLWEILNFAREQPFNDISDEQVIENCGHFYRADGTEKLLPMPTHCPREIYDLMCECWNRDDSLRPAFREIHMFLQRKNMGFNPLEDKQRVGAGISMGTLGPKGSTTNIV